MSGACPGGDNARDLAVDLRHRELKRGAREQAIRFGAQHRADVGSRNPNVATLEHDPQLADAARSCSSVATLDRKSTRLNSSHRCISYAVFCLKKKKDRQRRTSMAMQG